MKANQDIRQYAAENHVMLWEIAERLGLADCNFSRKLRHELPDADKAQIMEIIDAIAAERAAVAAK